MAKQRHGKPKGALRKPSGPPGSRIKKMESYEDTLEEGGVDDHMYKRDRIMFNPQDESDQEDLSDHDEEVLALPTASSSRARPRAAEEDDEEQDEEEEAAPRRKRKEKKKLDVSGKGRFGKTSDDEDELEESGSGDSEDEDNEGWGRSYYSRPSTRKEKEKEGEYDEKKEEEKEMEAREARRLARKAREGIAVADFGLDDSLLDAEVSLPAGADEAEETRLGPAVPAPETTDASTLIKHMELHEPLKIALIREWPLVVRKLEKTARGMKAIAAETEGNESLHKGLGWLHYQSLLTYATTLAFYLHLASLPAASRPDLSTHPVLPRLLKLKEGVSSLESLDFAAMSVSDVPSDHPERVGLSGIGGDDEEDDEEDNEELLELMRNKRELIKRMQEASGLGVEDGSDDEDGGDEVWRKAGLEAGELEELLADAEAEDLAPTRPVSEKSSKSLKSAKKQKKSDKVPAANGTTSTKPAFATLEEPEFVASSSKKKRVKRSTSDDVDDLGDPTALLDADASDKERRKRSLAFHTAKIASTAARREAARQQRLGGDDDVPYRDKRAARAAALQKNSAASAAAAGPYTEVEALDDIDVKKKRRREEELGDADDDDAAGDYYDLVKRRKADKVAQKAEAHEERRAEKFASFEDESADGPRTITRAIEKNRGLTPRRNKAGRNPRVKKRQAYEKAKQRVGSQRAVFKGGQAALGGSYGGEKSGISTVIKSRRF